MNVMPGHNSSAESCRVPIGKDYGARPNAIRGPMAVCRLVQFAAMDGPPGLGGFPDGNTVQETRLGSQAVERAESMVAWPSTRVPW